MIGQAKGILMERFGIPAEEAFHRLIRASQDTNVKLADVAHWLSTQAPDPTATAALRENLGPADSDPRR